MLKHRVLIGEKEIAARVDELARLIQSDLPTPHPVFVGLLTGSFVFLADLARAVARLGIEPAVEFMATSHYGDSIGVPSTVTITKDVKADLHGRAVLVVDDIVDSGLTLRAVSDHLADRGAEWVRTCVLLDKPSRRLTPLEADYAGFQVPDVWVIGYGLDARGVGRCLPYIGAIEPEQDEEA